MNIDVSDLRNEQDRDNFLKRYSPLKNSLKPLTSGDKVVTVDWDGIQETQTIIDKSGTRVTTSRTIFTNAYEVVNNENRMNLPPELINSPPTDLNEINGNITQIRTTPNSPSWGTGQPKEGEMVSITSHSDHLSITVFKVNFNVIGEVVGWSEGRYLSKEDVTQTLTLEIQENYSLSSRCLQHRP